MERDVWEGFGASMISIITLFSSHTLVVQKWKTVSLHWI